MLYFTREDELVMRWILSISIIAIALGLAATAAIPAMQAPADEPSLKFLPPDTGGLAVIDVAALRSVPLLQPALKNKTQLNPEVQDFLTATGIDPATDVDKVTVARLGEKDGLIIIQGRFDKFKVEQYLAGKGQTTETYLGQTLYRDRDGATVFLNNVLVIGQVDAVKKVIDQAQLPGSQPLRSDLLAAVRSIGAGSQIWAAGDFSLNPFSGSNIPGPASQALDLFKSLQTGTLEVRIDSDFHARLTGNFADANSARSIEDLGRGMLGLVRLQMAQKQPDLAQLLDGIQINSNGSTLTLRVDAPSDLLKKLQDSRTATVLKK
jgi:hypothetical protein